MSVTLVGANPPSFVSLSGESHYNELNNKLHVTINQNDRLKNLDTKISTLKQDVMNKKGEIDLLQNSNIWFKKLWILFNNFLLSRLNSSLRKTQREFTSIISSTWAPSYKQHPDMKDDSNEYSFHEFLHKMSNELASLNIDHSLTTDFKPAIAQICRCATFIEENIAEYKNAREQNITSAHELLAGLETVLNDLSNLPAATTDEEEIQRDLIAIAKSTIVKAKNKIALATVDDLSGAAPIQLNPCTDEEAQFILSQTSFIEHKTTWMSTSIGEHDIDDVGLAPAFSMTYRSTQFYLSKVFEFEEIPNSNPKQYMLAAIAYVKDESTGKFKPNMIYLSERDNLWRIVPMMDGKRMGKGLEFEADKPVKPSTNIPFDVGLALHWMHKQASDTTLIRNTPENKEQLTTLFGMIPDNRNNYLIKYQSTLKTRNATDEFINAHHLETLDLIGNIQPEHYPDFAKMKKYSIDGTCSDKLTMYQTTSMDGQYEYVFYEAPSHDPRGTWKESQSHPWLASVTKVGSPLTPYLVHETACFTHGAEISGASYWDYVKEVQGIEDNVQYNKYLSELFPQGFDNATTVPTWELRKNFKIIQLFEDWKNA